jgi:hypothetical protein
LASRDRCNVRVAIAVGKGSSLEVADSKSSMVVATRSRWETNERMVHTEALGRLSGSRTGTGTCVWKKGAETNVRVCSDDYLGLFVRDLVVWGKEGGLRRGVAALELHVQKSRCSEVSRPFPDWVRFAVPLIGVGVTWKH